MSNASVSSESDAYSNVPTSTEVYSVSTDLPQLQITEARIVLLHPKRLPPAPSQSSRQSANPTLSYRQPKPPSTIQSTPRGRQLPTTTTHQKPPTQATPLQQSPKPQQDNHHQSSPHSYQYQHSHRHHGTNQTKTSHQQFPR